MHKLCGTFAAHSITVAQCMCVQWSVPIHFITSPCVCVYVFFIHRCPLSVFAYQISRPLHANAGRRLLVCAKTLRSLHRDRASLCKTHLSHGWVWFFTSSLVCVRLPGGKAVKTRLRAKGKKQRGFGASSRTKQTEKTEKILAGLMIYRMHHVVLCADPQHKIVGCVIRADGPARSVCLVHGSRAI